MRGRKGTVYATKPKADLFLGLENARCGTQKSHGMKTVGLGSENTTSQLMV